jgi:hypothetical protein
MTTAPPVVPPPIPPPAAALERHFKWSSAAMGVFILALALLAVMAVVAAITPVHSRVGLPDDPDVRAARALVATTLAVPTGDLRFESALFEPGASSLVPAVAAVRARAADSLLERARMRALAESRIPALQGHLALALRHYEAAERLYRHAIDLTAHTSEARLGLGVALALRAEATHDQRDARALTLRAIAQFAAVRADAPVHAVALYDRALLLARVGRTREAVACAREYFAGDSTSAWSARLREATAIER